MTHVGASPVCGRRRFSSAWLFGHPDDEQPRVPHPGQPERELVESCHEAREGTDPGDEPEEAVDHQHVAVHQDAEPQEAASLPGADIETDPLQQGKGLGPAQGMLRDVIQRGSTR